MGDDADGGGSSAASSSYHSSSDEEGLEDVQLLSPEEQRAPRLGARSGPAPPLGLRALGSGLGPGASAPASRRARCPPGPGCHRQHPWPAPRILKP